LKAPEKEGEVVLKVGAEVFMVPEVNAPHYRPRHHLYILAPLLQKGLQGQKRKP